jgi:hypothetical protein
MPDAAPDETTAVERPGVPCRHLRHQGMYVFTDGRSRDPDQDYDSTIYWCLKTMKGYGPDDEPVERRACLDPARPCHEPL